MKKVKKNKTQESPDYYFGKLRKVKVKSLPVYATVKAYVPSPR